MQAARPPLPALWCVLALRSGAPPHEPCVVRGNRAETGTLSSCLGEDWLLEHICVYIQMYANDIKIPDTVIKAVICVHIHMYANAIKIPDIVINAVICVHVHMYANTIKIPDIVINAVICVHIHMYANTIKIPDGRRNGWVAKVDNGFVYEK